MNQHCAKHDKVFDPEQGQSCLGCETEKGIIPGKIIEAPKLERLADGSIKGPDDTINELRSQQVDPEKAKRFFEFLEKFFGLKF